MNRAIQSTEAIMDAIDKLPLPNPAIELMNDLAQDGDVLLAEAEALKPGIEAAAVRIGRGENAALNARFLLYAFRRMAAILRAVNLRAPGDGQVN